MKEKEEDMMNKMNIKTNTEKQKGENLITLHIPLTNSMNQSLYYT